MLPNFFIVGAPKAGTTSLFYYLNEHPEVYMSSIKEPNYFSWDEIKKQNLYYKEKNITKLEEYKKLFEGVKDEKAIGEASVSYLFYPTVPQKIENMIPNAKIIIMLRDPIERAFSHYLMDLRLGYVNIPFGDIIYRKSNSRIVSLYYQQYVELGLYFGQIKRYIGTFGKEHVKIFIFDDLKNNVKKIISSLYSFLDVDRNFVPNLEEKYNVFEIPKNNVIKPFYNSMIMRSCIKKILPDSYKSKIKKAFFSNGRKPVIDEEIKNYLKNIYAEDRKKLEALLEINLNTWCAS